MLQVTQVTKKYGKVPANQDITFAVPDHSISLLVGPNGAGKSTLMKCIMGLLRYTGEITINGHPNKSLEAKRYLGYVPEIPNLYPLLTVGEHLEFVARMYKLKNWDAYADELLARFDLDDKRNKLGSELSKGMQQKLSICTALLPKPAFILFDEPLVGLDPHAIKELKQVFRELSEAGQSLMISTHILDSVDEIWTQVMIMADGRLVCVAEKDRLDQAGKTLEDLFFEVTEPETHAAMIHMDDMDPHDTGSAEVQS